MTAYRPTFVKQLDGSQYQNLNCGPAAGAMALERDTLGAKRSTGARIRELTGDTLGGTALRQVALAIQQGYGTELDVETPIPTADALRRLDAGEAFVLNGSSSATKGTRWQASETFAGNHSWYVNERRHIATGWEYLVYDPLADGRRPAIAQSPFWLPASVLFEFAAGLNIGTTARRVLLGPGKFYAMFTHDTEPHLVLRYGGVALKPPQPKTIAVPAGRRANVRAIPSTASKLMGTLPNGAKWTAYQMTRTGQLLAGSRTWYGNIDGTRWLHISAF